LCSSSISRNCFRKFLLPEANVRRWIRAKTTPFVPMPKTTVNLNHCTVFPKNHVGPTRQLCDMKPVSKALPMQRSPERQFGLGIPSPNSGHHPRTGGSVYDIGHQSLPWSCLQDSSSMLLANTLMN
jgi:hypothetical protein